jgi:Pyridoxal-dependent decarboxylase conserved domain
VISSGHKFGLSYVGVGWVVWRDKAHLPKDLIFELHYLGSVEYSFSLNFSRPAAPIIAQYFNLIHLGFEGYRAIALDDLRNSRLLSRALEKSEYYTVLSDIHRKAGDQNVVGIDDDVEVRHAFTYGSFLDIVFGSSTSLDSLWYVSVSRISSTRSIQRFSKNGFKPSSGRRDGELLLKEIEIAILCLHFQDRTQLRVGPEPGED